MPSSDGLIQQRGDILLLVAMGCTKDHHTVLQRREAHAANLLIWVAAGSCWLSQSFRVFQSFQRFATLVAKHSIQKV